MPGGSEPAGEGPSAACTRARTSGSSRCRSATSCWTGSRHPTRPAPPPPPPPATPRRRLSPPAPFARSFRPSPGSSGLGNRGLDLDLDRVLHLQRAHEGLEGLDAVVRLDDGASGLDAPSAEVLKLELGRRRLAANRQVALHRGAGAAAGDRGGVEVD